MNRGCCGSFVESIKFKNSLKTILDREKYKDFIKSPRSRINADIYPLSSTKRKEKKRTISFTQATQVIIKSLILPVVYERDFLNSHYFTVADTIVDRTIRSFHKDPVPDLIVFSAFAHKSGTV